MSVSGHLGRVSLTGPRRRLVYPGERTFLRIGEFDGFVALIAKQLAFDPRHRQLRRPFSLLSFAELAFLSLERGELFLCCL
jgi:hypothetical protein